MRRSEVSGIPCFWAEAPPPFTATLVFRVGRADETLPTAGITHLSEHILMPASPPRELDRNARVEDIYAVFWASGSPTRALRFLEGLADLIAAPPLDRLETERSILRTEAAGGGSHPVNASMALRYGAAAHGLMGYDELGLHGLGAEDVSEWIGEFFTRENAALWLTGEPPRDLELPLPAGRRRPPPEAVTLEDVEFPAVHADGPYDMVVVAFDADRSPALSTASAVLVDRAWQTIRYDRGLAYDIGNHFERLTAKVVHETVWVESLTENVDVVRDVLLELLRDLAENGPTEKELEEDLDRIRDDLDEPAELPGFLHYAACEHLLGREVSEAEYLRRREEVTSEATAEAMRPVLERLLIAVPTEEQVPEGFTTYPLTSSRVVTGRVHRSSALPITRAVRNMSLTVGAEGLTVQAAKDTMYTVLDRDLAAVLRWPDGSRTVWGHDGTRLLIDPSDWRKGEAVVAAIDERVPDELVVQAEPELVRTQDAVEHVASEKLKRRWVVDEELKMLPAALGPDEEVLTVAEANIGLRSGLLAATDRRLLWLYKMIKERQIEIEYADIRHVRAKRSFLTTNVVVETDTDRFSFEEIAPKGRATELEGIIRERLGLPAG